MSAPQLGGYKQCAFPRDDGLPCQALSIVAQQGSERQIELYAQGRNTPGPIATYKRGGELKHNKLPAPALGVAFLLADGNVSWSGRRLSKFARLLKVADARVQWGGDWPVFKDRPHFEV